MLSEITHHKKTNVVWFHLYEVPKVVKFIETESRVVVAMGWRENEQKTSRGYGDRVLLRKNKKSSDGYTTK